MTRSRRRRFKLFVTALPDLSQLSHAEKDALILALWQRLEAAERRIAELEARLAQMEENTRRATEVARTAADAVEAKTKTTHERGRTDQVLTLSERRTRMQEGNNNISKIIIIIITIIYVCEVRRTVPVLPGSPKEKVTEQLQCV